MLLRREGLKVQSTQFKSCSATLPTLRSSSAYLDISVAGSSNSTASSSAKKLLLDSRYFERENATLTSGIAGGVGFACGKWCFLASGWVAYRSAKMVWKGIWSWVSFALPHESKVLMLLEQVPKFPTWRREQPTSSIPESTAVRPGRAALQHLSC